MERKIRKKRFIDTLRDNFLHQHVNIPTRFRHGQNPTLDDLILSSTEDMIQDITYSDPLGKSDHLCLAFTIDVMPEISHTSQMKFKMDKGDYEKMKNLFDIIDWETELEGKSIEESWNYFANVYHKVTDECIPKYPVKPARWRRPLWMTSAAVKLKKRIPGLEKIRRHGALPRLRELHQKEECSTKPE